MFVQHINNFIGMKIYVSGHLYTLEIKLILPNVCFKITNLFLEFFRSFIQCFIVFINILASSNFGWFCSNGEPSSARWLYWSRIKAMLFYFQKILGINYKNNLAFHLGPVEPSSEGSPLCIFVFILTLSNLASGAHFWSILTAAYPRRPRSIHNQGWRLILWLPFSILKIF